MCCSFYHNKNERYKNTAYDPIYQYFVSLPDVSLSLWRSCNKGGEREKQLWRHFKSWLGLSDLSGLKLGLFDFANILFQPLECFPW